MKIWCTSTAHTVFRHTRMRETDSALLALHTARNATVGAQVAMRHCWHSFEIRGWDIAGLPEGVSVCSGVQEYVDYNDGIPYPDRLTKNTHISVPANATQGIVLQFRTVPEAATGSFCVTVTVHTHSSEEGEQELAACIVLQIHTPVLPEPKDSTLGHEYHFEPFISFSGEEQNPCTPFYTFEEQSEEWWAYMAECARYFRLLRINAMPVRSLELLQRGGSRQVEKNVWHLDFSFFDRYVELFLTHGSFNRLAIMGFIQAVTGEYVWSLDESGNKVQIPLFGERHEEVTAWVNALLSGIIRHCTEKGWRDMLCFNLEDEPHTTEAWLWAREICRSIDPEIPCLEPIDTVGISRELGENCDIPIPRIEVYDHDVEYFDEWRQKGNTMWCYSCCAPNDPEWMNKFVDWPTYHSRLLYWGCYSQDIAGYLHWGFSRWIYGGEPGTQFKGDGFIVYPDVENNSLLLSNRGLATIEGVEEWELLTLLGQKYPEATKALARRIVRTFRDFIHDPAELDAARAELLTLADAL